MTDRKEAAHTPGPWWINGKQSIRGPNGEYIAKVNWRGGIDDARLIAAAPELLAELADCPCPRPVNGAPDDTTVEQCVSRGECGCSCGRVIAKATGVALKARAEGGVES